MLKRILNRKMMAILFLGIASGVPYGVVATLLQAWATEAGISLKTISLAGLTQVPYTWKFVWSPLMDRYCPPFLGRRRGWMLICQIAMFLSIFTMGQFDPKESLTLILALAILVSFAGASHDIVIDAYRRDILADEDLGFGSALATNSYLIGYRYMAVVMGLLLAQYLNSWEQTFMVLAGFTVIGIVGTFIAPNFEGKISIPKTLKDAIVLPFKDFLKRPGALEILVFIVLYKIGDNFAQQMATPFYLKMGYAKSQIAITGKLVGFWCMFTGGFIGGFFLLKASLRKCLLWFGILQGLANLCFIPLAYSPPADGLLAFAVGMENLTAGMGTAAFAAFLAKLSSRQFSATQYAFLTSLMAFSRIVLPSIFGISADLVSWPIYFSMCTACAIPGILMILWRGKKWTT